MPSTQVKTRDNIADDRLFVLPIRLRLDTERALLGDGEYSRVYGVDISEPRQGRRVEPRQRALPLMTASAGYTCVWAFTSEFEGFDFSGSQRDFRGIYLVYRNDSSGAMLIKLVRSSYLQDQFGRLLTGSGIGDGSAGGDDAKWRGARIAHNVLMLVNRTIVPRILTLDEIWANTAFDYDGVTRLLGGLPAPKNIGGVSGSGNSKFFPQGSGGNVTAGTCRIKIRCFDENTGARSSFLQLRNSTDSDDNEAVVEGDSILVDLRNYPGGPHRTWFPARCTHVEIWRAVSRTGGVDYRLEKIVPVDIYANGNLSSEINDTFLLTYSDEVLERLDYLEDADIDKGLPPSSSLVMSFKGVTLLAGLSSPPSNPSFTDPRSGATITIDWPKGRSWTEISFSRTDRIEPEAFPARNKLMLPGDEIRNWAATRDEVVVVATRGVYIIVRTELGIDMLEVSRDGSGTPWADSVCSMGDMVFWARRDGVYMYRAGQIQNVIPGLKEWLEDAFDNNQNIQMAVDHRRGTLVIRRTVTKPSLDTSGSDEEYTDGAEAIPGTDQITLLQDLQGVAFADTRHVVTSRIPLLFSVQPDGTILEEFKPGDVYPGGTSSLYDFTIDGSTITLSGTTLTVVGGTSPFNYNTMPGLHISFYNYSEVAPVRVFKRRIVSVSSSGGTNNVLTLSAGLPNVPPNSGDGIKCSIGNVEFRLRFRPITGSGIRNTKIVRAPRVTAVPDVRHRLPGSPPQTPDTALTVRLYRDFDDDNPIEDEAPHTGTGSGVPIANLYDAVTDRDRTAAVQATGHAIEIEIENVLSEADFRILDVTAGEVIDEATTTVDSE